MRWRLDIVQATDTPARYDVPDAPYLQRPPAVGAEFTLTAPKTVIVDIYISQYPVSDNGPVYVNTDENMDLWRPSLIRIGDA